MNDPVENAPASAGDETGAEHIIPETEPCRAERQKKQTSLSVIDGGATAPTDDLLRIASVKRFARARGFRHADIHRVWREEMVNGYPKRTAWAKFTATDIVVSGVEPPSQADKEEMLAEIAEANLPKHTPLTAIAEPPPGVSLTDRNVFLCHDAEGRIVMIHQRYQTREGGKGFVPWTRWSDGQWRKMEPEVMPFYGLPGYKEASTLVLHEGPNGPRRLAEFMAGTAEVGRFPWFERMRHAHHVGWLGGVHAIGRSDWPFLAGLGWKKVIVVADNDRNGNGLRAARTIASNFRENVFILSFDQRFGDGFDLGDDWPASMFNGEGCYIGPDVDECLSLATLATRLIPAVGRGRPTAVIRDEFARAVAYTVDPPRFILLHRPDRDLSEKEFNATVAPYSHVRDTATKVLGSVECQHDKLTYHPGYRPGTLHMGGSKCFNVYAPPRVIAIEGDAAPWLEFLEHLFPDPVERAIVMCWLATLIVRPDVRMRYGLLLISTRQGVGKNTLANILKPLLGASNVSFPSERSVVDSQFNGWLARKRLIFVAEIYSGSSRKAYDKLKPVLSDTDIEVNEKNIPAHHLDLWATVIACSNSEAALHLDDEDRRWFVPTVAENLQPRQWWERLYAWLEGDGAGIIRHWAERYVEDHGHVRTGDHAPDSKRKRAIVEGSRSEGQQLAVALAEHLVGLDRPVILKLGDVRRWIATRRGFWRGNEPDLSDRRMERPSTIIAALRKVEGVTVWADNLRPKFGLTREAVVMNFTPGLDQRWVDIKESLTSLKGVGLDEPF